MTLAVPQDQQIAASARPTRRGMVLLRAAGARIDVRNRDSVRVLIGTKQVWQSDAWVYRDLIPELRFAGKFIANAVGRARFVGAVVNVEGDDPILFSAKPEGISPELMAAVEDELSRLPIASGAKFQGAVAENFDITGECWLHGYIDELARERWEVLSVDEVQVQPDGVLLLKNGKGQIRHQVDPAKEEMLRLWLPHPRYSDFADSPMRAMQDLCGEIVLNGRERRAVRRSRAAANGMLLLPEGLSLLPATRDAEDQDPDSDEFMSEFMGAMLAPINNEGEPGAVVPMVLKGNPEDLREVRHITFVREDSKLLLESLDNALNRLGTGLDMPPEILSGIGQTNHWSGAQIDQNTYRYHIDPRLRNIADSFTEGYLWPMLVARDQFTLDEISQVQVWFDAGNLTENPNRGSDAKDAHDRLAIGDRALRDALGFTDEDAPSDEEVFRQIMLKTGMDSSTSALLIQRLLNPDQPLMYPTRETIADKEIGQAPQDEGGGTNGPLAPPAPAAKVPATPGGQPATQPATGTTQPAQKPSGLAAQRVWALGQLGLTDEQATGMETDVLTAIAESFTAAGELSTGVDWSVDVDASRELAAIEAALRDRILVAADAAMERALEKAGARIRSHANGKPEVRAKLADAAVEDFAAILGPDTVMALGLPASKLLEAAFAGLQVKWDKWVAQAVTQLAAAVVKLLRLDPASDKAKRIGRTIELAMTGRKRAGWNRLEAALLKTAERHLFHPTKDELGEQSDTLVPPGAVRAALAEVGGITPGSGGASSNGTGAAGNGTPAGGLVGDTVHQVVAQEGGSHLGYEWRYGPTPSPRGFHPHEELDGLRFGGWRDEKLSSAIASPPCEWVGPYRHPGDHDGCLCDYVAVWAIPEAREQTQVHQEDTQAMADVRALAEGDTAAGRTGTVAQATLTERNRIQELRQRFLDRNPKEVT
jgi:hypothetical protein